LRILGETGLEPATGGMDRFERIRIAQDLERLDGCRRGDPFPAYVPPWLTLSGRTLMTSSRPPKAGRRIAIAHRLGKRRQIRLDAEVLSRPAASEAKAGLDLVEDEQDPEFHVSTLDRLVEAGFWQDPLALPSTGSTMIAAISSPRASNRRRSASMLL